MTSQSNAPAGEFFANGAERHAFERFRDELAPLGWTIAHNLYVSRRDERGRLERLEVDLVLAGDNAIVVGALAAGLPADQRRKVIAIGIGAALVLRILFALIVTWLMGIVGLIFAGGLLLLWVSWKFWREIREGAHSPGSDEVAGDEMSGLKPAKSFAAAAWAVAVADVSMSLDNVLAVAGAAREHPGILVVGLLLSVALMGLAANVIARIIDRYRWIAYIGLAVIV